jgi:sulfur relay (sulfurtransferase) DsrF/TusC family protein
MKGAGIPVHVVREDIEERGIAPDSLVQEFDFVSGRELPALFARYDQVWHW